MCSRRRLHNLQAKSLTPREFVRGCATLVSCAAVAEVGCGPEEILDPGPGAWRPREFLSVNQALRGYHW